MKYIIAFASLVMLSSAVAQEWDTRRPGEGIIRRSCPPGFHRVVSEHGFGCVRDREHRRHWRTEHYDQD